MNDGGVGAGEVGFHQIDAGQEFVGGQNALVVHAGDVHEHGQSRAGADEHGLKALLFHQFVDCNRSAHHGVCGDRNAQSFQAVYFLLDNRLGQTEFRNAVYQHAARLMERLKNRHIIAQPCQIPGTGKSCRTGSDDRHLMTVLWCIAVGTNAIRPRPIRYEPLKLSNGYRFPLDPADANALTLALLRTNTTADRRKCR